MSKKSNAGRHFFDAKTKEEEAAIIAKLEDAFSNAFTDEMACLYANISVDSLYRYCDKYPEFRQRKEELKKRPDLKAQETLVRDLGQVSGARWWAERRMPEFMPKSKVEHAGKIETTDTTTSDAVKAVTEKYENELRETIAQNRKKRATQA